MHALCLAPAPASKPTAGFVHFKLARYGVFPAANSVIVPTTITMTKTCILILVGWPAPAAKYLPSVVREMELLLPCRLPMELTLHYPVRSHSAIQNTELGLVKQPYIVRGNRGHGRFVTRLRRVMFRKKKARPRRYALHLHTAELRAHSSHRDTHNDALTPYSYGSPPKNKRATLLNAAKMMCIFLAPQSGQLAAPDSCP